MQTGPHDPRDIPILTDAVEEAAQESPSLDAKPVHAAILTETLKLADSLLHQAAKDIEATLFERVFDRLRAQLPELVDRILREHAAASLIAPEPVVIQNPLATPEILTAQDDPKDHG